MGRTVRCDMVRAIVLFLVQVSIELLPNSYRAHTASMYITDAYNHPPYPSLNHRIKMSLSFEKIRLRVSDTY